MWNPGRFALSLIHSCQCQLSIHLFSRCMALIKSSDSLTRACIRELMTSTVSGEGSGRILHQVARLTCRDLARERSLFFTTMERACGCVEWRRLQIINSRKHEKFCSLRDRKELHGILPCYAENQSLWHYRLPDSFKSRLGCHALDCCTPGEFFLLSRFVVKFYPSESRSSLEQFCHIKRVEE